MPATAAVVQMAINPKMPRINHPVNHLDHQSNEYVARRQVLLWDPLRRVVKDLLATIDNVEI